MSVESSRGIKGYVPNPNSGCILMLYSLVPLGASCALQTQLNRSDAIVRQHAARFSMALCLTGSRGSGDVP
jgi:hypothetical protein